MWRSSRVGLVDRSSGFFTRKPINVLKPRMFRPTLGGSPSTQGYGRCRALTTTFFEEVASITAARFEFCER